MQRRDSVVAVLDIGGGTSDLAVIHGTLVYPGPTGSINFGGLHVMSAIAEAAARKMNVDHLAVATVSDAVQHRLKEHSRAYRQLSSVLC